MTDLETMEAMLDRAGVVYSEETIPGNRAVVELRMEQGGAPPNQGYPGFVAVLGFNVESGALLWVGAFK